MSGQPKPPADSDPKIPFDASGRAIVTADATRVERPPFEEFARRLQPVPVDVFIPYRLLIASLTPQKPSNPYRKISIEAIRPTVYRTPGNFVQFGRGDKPTSTVDAYRAMGLHFRGEIPRNGFWIDFVLNVAHEPTRFQVKTPDGITTADFGAVDSNVVVSTDVSGPKPDDGTETTVYLEQIVDGPSMPYWSFLRADVYAVLIGPRPPSHLSFPAVVDELERLDRSRPDDDKIVRVTLATNQDDGVVSYWTSYLRYQRGPGGMHALESMPYDIANYLFSDRNLKVGDPPLPGQFDTRMSQPFSVLAPDRIGMRLNWRDPIAASMEITLQTWGNSRFSVELSLLETVLHGIGPGVGPRVREAAYLLSFQSVEIADVRVPR